MNITGHGLGLGGRVLIGSERCQHSKWTPEEISCTLPPNTDGDQAVTVEVTKIPDESPGAEAGDLIDGSWYAAGDFSVTYTFRVTGVSATAGSLLGGTEVVISGDGFPCGDVTVAMGDDYICAVDVSRCTPTSIACR